ncbi:MAG: GNAT family N-acetyltransferase [Rhizobiales bacterium]|nr:GNAT family N-acetyltransferase [Hyphomicrobiales bacterium]
MHETTGLTHSTVAATALPRTALAPVAARPAPSASGLTVDLIEDLSGFAALEDDWRALESRAPCAEYFCSFDWCWVWWQHFGAQSGAAPLLLTIRRGSGLVAIMPLALESAGPYRYARLMGAGTGQYGDILVDQTLGDRRPLHTALWTGLKRARIDTLHLDLVRDDANLAAFLAPLAKCAGQEEPSYEVVTGNFADFDAYMASRPSSLRKDLRRRRRRLSEQGAPAYGLVTDPDAIAKDTVRAVELKRQWLAERGLHGRFLARANVGDWMADIAQRAHGRGRLHFSVLRVGGNLAATQIAFGSEGRLVGYFGAFDVAHSRHSVGKLHLEDHLADIFDSRVTLDLLPPADSYKAEWATPGIHARSYTLPVSAVGRIVSLVHNPVQRQRLKRAYLALPGALRASFAARVLGLAGTIKRAATGGARRTSHTPLSQAKDQQS